MKEKILAELQKKFKGLPKAFLELFATKLAAKVTEDSQIEGAITELDNLPVSVQDLAAEYQREGDRRVTEARRTFDQTPPAPPAPPAPAPDPNQPEWAKTFTAQFSQLTQLVQGLVEDKSKTTLMLKAQTELKDVPEVFWNKRMFPIKVEDLEPFIQEVKTDWSAFEQANIDKGLIIKKPENGTETEAGKNKKVDAEILGYVKANTPAPTAIPVAAH